MYQPIWLAGVDIELVLVWRLLVGEMFDEIIPIASNDVALADAIKTTLLMNRDPRSPDVIANDLAALHYESDSFEFRNVVHGGT